MKENPHPCDSCEHDYAPTKQYRRMGYVANPDDHEVWLCHICANTKTGVDFQYNREEHRTMSVIAYAANEILSRIGGMR